MTLRLFAILIFVASFVGGLPAAPSTPRPELSGDAQTYDDKTQETVLRGHAHAICGTRELMAEEIRYHVPTQTITARGQAVFTNGAQRLLADTISYRLTDDTYTAENLRFGKPPLFVEGQAASGTKTKLTVSHATVSLREPGPWAPTLAADTLVCDEGGHLHAEQAHLGLGGVRPIKLPHLNMRLDQPLRSYVSLGAGYRGSLGAYGEAELRVPVADSVRLGGNLDFYSARGGMIGPAGDYMFGAGTDYETSGSFRSGYINDHGEKKIDVLGRPVPEDRGYASWQHRQNIGPRLVVDAKLNYWRDSEIIRDFRPDEFFPVQTPDNTVEAVYTGGNYHLSLFSRFQPNRYHAVQERLPELRFDLLPVALPGGIFARFESSVAALREDPPGSAQPGLRSDRYDAYGSLERTFAAGDWFAFTPIVGGRATHYARTLENSGRDDYTRWLGELGFDAQLRTNGVFNYRNERWHINGLRHLLTPHVSYRYIPEGDRGLRYIPSIDRRVFSTDLPTLGLGDSRNIDDLTATDTLRLGIDNTLQTRDSTYGSRNLAVLNFANDFRRRRQPGERVASETHVQLGIMPVSWMQFDLRQSIAPQDGKTHELNTGFTVHDGNVWSLRLATHYLAGDIAEYALEHHWRLRETFETFFRVQYDSRRQRFNERTVGISQNLANTWMIRYSATVYDGPRRESRFGFHIEVRSLGF